MNLNSYIILIDGNDETETVAKCEKTDVGYDITYKSSGKKYSFGFSRVQVLPLVGAIEGSKIYINGALLENVLEVLDYGERKKVIFENGCSRVYKAEDMRLEANCLQHGNTADKLSYLAELAEEIGLKSDSGSSILARQYESLDFVGEECALGFYLSPDRELDKAMSPFPMIFPFGLNPSQKKATANALTSRVSIIEGPPGTGKTQTILNIIANLVMRGKTIAVVSGNNSATANIFEKLEKNGFAFICAPLGSRTNKSHFISKQSGRYPDMSSWARPTGDVMQLKSATNHLVVELDEMMAAQNRIADIREQLSELKREKQYFDSYYEQESIHSAKKKPNLKTDSKRLLDLWLECESFTEKSQIPGFWFRLKRAFIYGPGSFSFLKQASDKLISALQDMYYEICQKELEKEQSLLQSKLDGYRFQDKMKELGHKSMILFKAFLAGKFGKGIERKVFDISDLWKDYSGFLKEYPVVLSTTYSIRSSLSKNCVFDYVIIDEASQVDIVTGAPALANARNAVIVGDLLQLPHVVTQEQQKIAAAISCKYQLEKSYDYLEHSLLSSAASVWKNVPKTLLREHYRCHPKIIGFCNQKFYNNQLVVMTEDRGEDDVLGLYYTRPGNHARNHMNQRQIDVINKEIIPELADSLDNIGIVAPYRAQANAVAGQFQGYGIEADTVHKYQGREKNNIIISTVDNQIGEFADNPNLLNVAVSRAIKRLRLVVSPDDVNENTNTGDLIKYIRYQNFLIVHSEVRSIFDFLYKQYTEKRLEFFKRCRRVSEYDSENLMYYLIVGLLTEPEFCKLDLVMHLRLKILIRDLEKLADKQRAYVLNPSTHLDFVIYNKMDKMPVLVVEVDGVAYHREGSRQYERDRMKDEILKAYNIPFLRLSTDGSMEDQHLRTKLSKILKA